MMSVFRNRLTLVATFALVTTFSTAARATHFDAGSLIIPMDECYQYDGTAQTSRLGWNAGALPNRLNASYSATYSAGSSCIGLDTSSVIPDAGVSSDPYYPKCWGYGSTTPSSTGIQHAFGLLYLLAKNNIPVNVIIRSNKEALGDYDFSVASPGNGYNPVFALGWKGVYGSAGTCVTGSGSSCYGPIELAGSSTGMGGASIYYKGAPFVIDAAYAQQAISVLTSFNGSQSVVRDVLIHVARSDFDAPVQSAVQTTPKPIALIQYSNSSGINIAKKYLNDAGIVTVLGSAAAAYVTAAVKTTGSGSVQSVTFSNGASSFTSFDVTWAPDINTSTCEGVIANPKCLNPDNGGLCNPEACAGTKAWCCTTAPSSGSYDSFTTSDGTSYYCPCGNSTLVPGGKYTCSVDNFDYSSSGTQCVTALGTKNSCASGICMYTTQHCRTQCTSDADCTTGHSCIKVTDGGSCTRDSDCPSYKQGSTIGYTCVSNVCTANLCLKNNYCSSCGTGQYCMSTAPVCPNNGSSTPSCPGGVSPVCPSGGSATCVAAQDDRGNNFNDSTGSQVKAASCGAGNSPPYCPICYSDASATWYNPAKACSSCDSDSYCDTTTAPTCTSSGATCPNGATPTCETNTPDLSGTPACASAGATATCANGSKPFCPVCLPKWGCSVNCTSCGGGSKGSGIWASLRNSYLNTFLGNNGRLLGTDNTALTAESSSSTAWLTTTGLSGTSGGIVGTAASNFCAAGVSTASATPLDSSGLYPASDVDLQIGDFFYKALGGNAPAYAPLASFIPGVRALAYYNGSSWVYPAIVGHPLVGGTVVYEGANNYGSSSSSAPLVKVGGQHIVYDTLLNSTGNAPGSGSNSQTLVELTRSTPVQGPSVLSSGTDVGGQVYVGTFDWGYTADALATGNNGYLPPSSGTPSTTCYGGSGSVSCSGTTPTCSSGTPLCMTGTSSQAVAMAYSPTCSGGTATCDTVYATYPSVTGHFREWKNNTDLATYSGVINPSCGGSSDPCTWDAYSKVQSQSSRNIYIPIYSSSTSTWTLKQLATGDSSFITAFGVSTQAQADQLVNIILQSKRSQPVLGGIDHSTPAVIEEAHGLVSVPSTAVTRPTIAYVGARDGLIHAFCVHAKGSVNSHCYGTSATSGGWAPGEEIFAVMPPSIAYAMGQKYLANSVKPDFSNINVGGIMRVADVKEDFGSGSRSWKTVLIYGTRNGGGGAVGALEISDPNPTSNLNARTSSDASGLNFLWETTGQSGITGDTVVSTMGPTNGASIAQPGFVSVAIVTAESADKTGMNTYVLQIKNGQVLSSDTSRSWGPSAASPLYQPGLGSIVANDVPPLPTIVDSDGDYSDDLVLLADIGGKVRKSSISETASATTLTVSFGSPSTIFDAVSTYSASISSGTNPCNNNVDCQPITTSPSIVKTASNTMFAVVGTGGVDWADTTSTTRYHIYEFDFSGSGKHTIDLTSVTTPLTFGGASAVRPLRIYAQPTIVGTDIYVNLTTLGVNDSSNAQLTLPFQHPASPPTTYWGLPARFASSTDTALSSVACTTADTCAFASSANYSGSTAMLYSESGTTGSTTKTVTMLGGGVINRVSVANGGGVAAAIRDTTLSLVAAQTRAFKVLGWFGVE